MICEHQEELRLQNELNNNLNNKPWLYCSVYEVLVVIYILIMAYFYIQAEHHV